MAETTTAARRQDRPPGRRLGRRSASVPGIDMLVAGGKTSTLTQFTELARCAGLEVIAACTQASGRLAVECRPVR